MLETEINILVDEFVFNHGYNPVEHIKSRIKSEKSIKNKLKDKGYDSVVYRLFCLQSHYRNQLVFSYEAMDSTKQAYKKLINRINNIKSNVKENDKIDDLLIKSYLDKFSKCLENDLNTSSALTVLYDVLKDDSLSNKEKIEITQKFDSVLSLNLLSSSENTIDNELEEYILEMIEKRNVAKKNRNYEEADLIRNQLLEKGIILKDGRDGTTFEFNM